ncbi:MAG: DUF2066 domain-containing protein [Marinobacterium sp.]|nr:DUF2066 domain-containing protein [Marinobacterium sp.]
MKKSFQRWLFTLAALVSAMLLPVTGLAGEVKGLYSATLLVPAQNSTPTTAQLARGLTGVLVRVAGNRTLLGKPAIQQALQTPDALLRRFEYRQTNRAVTDETGTEQPAQALAMEFDNALIERLLRESQERSLGSQRPTLMLWLAAEQNNRRDYISPDSRILLPLMSRARARGLPVQLPLYDLTDQQNLPVSDLWGLFQNGIEQASRRYRPDATLAGRMAPLPGGNWYIEWLLTGQGSVQRFTTEGSNDEALGEAVEQVADRLFAALGGATDSNYMEGLQLEVTNVRTLADYAAVVGYLEKLTLVTEVDVEQVDGARLLLRLQLDGRSEQLRRAIRLESRLAPASGNIAPADTDSDADEDALFLRYRWQG